MVGYQQEMPHLQSGHWNPTDPWQLIAHIDSCSFGSGLVNSPSPPLCVGGGELCQTPLFPSASLNEPAFWDRGINKAHSPTTLRDGGLMHRQVDWRLVVWTLLDVKGRSRHMWTDVLRFHTILSDCVPYVHFSIQPPKERTLWLPTSPAQCGVLRSFLCHYI